LKSNKLIRIAISGDLGSGKSVVSSLLAKHYNLTLYSTGSIQRKIANKLKVSTLRLNQISENNKNIDFEIDCFSKSLNDKKENFIIDSRLAWFFIKDIFKIFLSVDETIAANRVFSDLKRKSEKYNNFEQTLQAIKKRKKSEQNRYQNLYKINIDNYNHYDLVINTSHFEINEITNIIINSLEKFQNNTPFKNFKNNAP
jgi:predicted cytidylate kinase